MFEVVANLFPIDNLKNFGHYNRYFLAPNTNAVKIERSRPSR